MFGAHHAGELEEASPSTSLVEVTLSPLRDASAHHVSAKQQSVGGGRAHARRELAVGVFATIVVAASLAGVFFSDVLKRNAAVRGVPPAQRPAEDDEPDNASVEDDNEPSSFRVNALGYRQTPRSDYSDSDLRFYTSPIGTASTLEGSDSRPHDKLITWIVSATASNSLDWGSAADPFVVISTTSTSAETFGVGSCTYNVKKDQGGGAAWARKRSVLIPRGAVSKFRVQLWDDDLFDDDLALDVELPIPPPGPDWVEHLLTSAKGTVTLRARVKPWEEKIVSAAQISAFELSDTVLPLVGGQGALLQEHVTANGTKALLWLPGRNDAFYHPHVGEMLAERGYDLFVLNYRNVGASRRAQLFDNPYLNSHCESADFGEYHEEIDKALERIGSLKAYSHTLAYAHSTGGTILIDYLLREPRTAPFDGLVLNSPFVDWAQGGATEHFLEKIPKLLLALPFVPTTLNVDPGFKPDGWSAYGLLKHADYEFDLRTAPLYQVPVTAGFVQGASKVHTKLEALKPGQLVYPGWPVLLLSSDADDVLDADEIELVRSSLSANVTATRFAANAHDVFTSDSAENNDAALGVFGAWLNASGL
ncbi:hypothetical protein T492DRAFT_1060114 [Pavlovales sp. CCMP2436]|nr:hypothetical protein T492DRAFT_1060114 [Pavlovales sp. CCMP2436]